MIRNRHVLVQRNTAFSELKIDSFPHNYEKKCNFVISGSSSYEENPSAKRPILLPQKEGDIQCIKQGFPPKAIPMTWDECAVLTC